MTRATRIFVIFCLLILAHTTISQDQTQTDDDTGITVPNIIGITLPEAAALLNQNSLRLGTQTFAQWLVASGQDVNTIGEQSPTAGTSVEPGTFIDFTLLRDNNTVLLYDSNDLTLLNDDEQDIRVREIVFRSNGTPQAIFRASDWQPRSVRSQQCLQVWSILRNGPKPVDACNFIQADGFLTTTNSSDHFWTGSGGATEFTVTQDGVYRGTCSINVDVANMGTDAEAVQQCELYLSPGAIPQDVIEYVYMSYTSDQLLLMNLTANQWLPTSQIRIIQGLTLGDPSLFDEEIIGNVELLAPGQCLRFIREGIATSTALPEDCHVIAEAILDDDDVFWDSNFNMDNFITQNARECLGAISNQNMICILPR